MSQLLYRFINSEHFSDDPFYTVTYLARYAEHIGIHHFLCTKLREFSYEEIEFFLPQLCHLLVSNENMQSVALEDFIFELCEQSAHGALLTFWLFQTHLHDLAGNPQLTAFKVCRRIYNRIQNIVFGSGETTKKKERLKENVLPVTVLASLIVGSIAAPILPRFAGPLAVAQARKQATPQETISEMPTKLARSKTTGSSGTRRRKERPPPLAKPSPSLAVPPPLATPDSRAPISPIALASPRRLKTDPKSTTLARRSSYNDMLAAPGAPPTSPSLPDLHSHRHSIQSADNLMAPSSSSDRRRQHRDRPLSPAVLSTSRKIHMLRANYFRREDQFLSALDKISNKLVEVPKQARLSALRAELALLNNDLPSEVDIPVICPATVHQNKSRTSHHRIVRINPAEATVLNSAERVPYLLMVEVLREDFDFDPSKHENETLLTNLLQEEASGSRQRMFDLSESPRQSSRRIGASREGPSSVFEPSGGDIGTSPINGVDETLDTSTERPGGESSSVTHWPRSSSGANSISTLSSRGGTPRSSDPGRSGSPGRKSGRPPNNEGPDLSALATHMRAAANMLAQLEASGGKRPKSEMAAIKAKIIASMQTLEEQSFFFQEATPIPTFDTIMASAATAPIPNYDDRVEEGDGAKPKNINSEAGAARMENDQMTSGVERIADRDDPSAATFGEEWTAKRERVRKSSPYGSCPNWDLLSVIVKTGADLRQEAFACQLIQVCDKIWQRAEVPVWLKRMRILVTGESSGLIETITNGTSLHSLKRSLTIASNNSGHNPRGRIASLKDHFVKTFGAEDTPTYAAAVDAFVRSLAAYSIICYILQLKDRHNGNVLIDNQGHIIHIDFGFMLSNSPGSVGFEGAPFKLTQEYVDVMGGVDSEAFALFRTLCKQAFQALRKSADNLVLLVELMGKGSRMPCFSSNAQYATSQLKQRFVLQMSEQEAGEFVDALVQKSLGNYFTRMYDQFQYLSQGIY